MNSKICTEFCGQTFSGIVINGSGVRCSTYEELDAIKESDAAGVVTKSFTLDPRQGNEEPRQHSLMYGSINCMGLPNNGLSYFLNYPHIKDNNVFVSVAPLNINNYEIILNKLTSINFKGFVEVNLSCPNVSGHPPIAYEKESVVKILNISSKYSEQLRIGYKLPPLLNENLIADLANLFNNSDTRFINTSSTLGNGIAIDYHNDLPLIKPKSGLGGIGGHYLKPVSLGNVAIFRKLLSDKIDIIGTGGIYTGRDIFEYVLCGASLVSVATSFDLEGVDIFKRLHQEFNDILKSKNICNINDIKGKIKINDM